MMLRRLESSAAAQHSSVSRIQDGRPRQLGAGGEEPEREAYRSMFRDSNWVLELAFLARRLLRRLAGILELPGIVE